MPKTFTNKTLPFLYCYFLISLSSSFPYLLLSPFLFYIFLFCYSHLIFSSYFSCFFLFFSFSYFSLYSLLNHFLFCFLLFFPFIFSNIINCFHSFSIIFPCSTTICSSNIFASFSPTPLISLFTSILLNTSIAIVSKNLDNIPTNSSVSVS